MPITSFNQEERLRLWKRSRIALGNIIETWEPNNLKVTEEWNRMFPDTKIETGRSLTAREMTKLKDEIIKNANLATVVDIQSDQGCLSGNLYHDSGPGREEVIERHELLGGITVESVAVWPDQVKQYWVDKETGQRTHTSTIDK